MRALILTVSAGEGHNSMSNAVANCLGEQCEVRIYDLFKDKHKVQSKTVNGFYFWLCQKNIKTANKMHKIIRNRNPKNRKATFAHSIAKPANPKLVKFLDEYKPDVIFTAHTYAALLMSDLKEKKGYKPPVISIVSDYDVSPYAECSTFIEYIVSPAKALDYQLIKKGFMQEQIVYMGIPVHTKFSEHIDKTHARNLLGINTDMFTVMIMNGGIGFGSTIDVIKNLAQAHNRFQIVVVNGRNEAMKNAIEDYIDKNNIDYIENIGFANNVDVIMSASDLLIGKIGGVAIAEAFNKKLPILAMHIQPWQEHYNMLFLKQHGACEYIENPAEIYKYVDALIDSPSKLSTIKRNMEKIAMPNATRDIAEFIVKLGNEYANNKEHTT